MATNREVSATVEEYLENIFRLQDEHGRARTKELAERVGVALGTVTNMVEDLENQDLVVHESYRGVILTEEGRRLALDVVRRHRLSERLLTDILKMPMSKVHKAACRLEHSLSEDMIKPLEKVLGHPRTCPHGNPIPTRCGGLIEEDSKPLKSFGPGDTGLVVKITEEEENLLQHLFTMGIVPGSFLLVEEKLVFDGSMNITVDGVKTSLSRDVASIIWVKKT